MSARSYTVVIGAGIGGLSAAIELAADGHKVVILERGAAPVGECVSS